MKKFIYIFLTVILGVMLSFNAHALIEVQYLKWMAAQGRPADFIFGCALPIYVNFGLTIAGAIGGYFLGQTWWRIVYIEKRRWKWAKKPW